MGEPLDFQSLLAAQKELLERWQRMAGVQEKILGEQIQNVHLLNKELMVGLAKPAPSRILHRQVINGAGNVYGNSGRYLKYKGPAACRFTLWIEWGNTLVSMANSRAAVYVKMGKNETTSPITWGGNDIEGVPVPNPSDVRMSGRNAFFHLREFLIVKRYEYTSGATMQFSGNIEEAMSVLEGEVESNGLPVHLEGEMVAPLATLVLDGNATSDVGMGGAIYTPSLGIEGQISGGAEVNLVGEKYQGDFQFTEMKIDLVNDDAPLFASFTVWGD